MPTNQIIVSMGLFPPFAFNRFTESFMPSLPTQPFNGKDNRRLFFIAQIAITKNLDQISLFIEYTNYYIDGQVIAKSKCPRVIIGVSQNASRKPSTNG
jgi:hypothetical protein